MADMKTTCPECGCEIKLEDTIAAPLLAAKDQEIAQKLAAQKQALEADAIAKAKAETADALDLKTKELEAAQSLMKEREEKLKIAQEKEATFLVKERELEEAKREMNLTIQKQVSQAQQEIFKKAQLEQEATIGLKLKEKDEQLSSMQKKIDELQKKATQGSQQLQGEALELLLEDDLASKFPHDKISPIAKGISGADVQQFVVSPTGQNAGSILWETKRTKNWSNEWVSKLKADQRKAGAEMAVLVSQTLPQGIAHFDFYEGIYVCAPRYAIPLALMIRQTLLSVSKTKQSQNGQQDKMALVYEYLTGTQFKQRVEAICEHFQTMQEELNKERSAMTRIWAKREKQITNVIENTVGLYGDLEGIAGRAMPQIDGLTLDALEDLSGDEG